VTVPKSVPSSVAPSTSNSVAVITTPIKGPLLPSTGSFSPYNGQPVDKVEGAPVGSEIQPSPWFGGNRTTGQERESGSSGAPSLPEMNGVLFRKGPVDSHYQSEFQGGVDPYRKVNNPPTRGMLTWVKGYINGILTSQDVDNTGFRVRHPQQRTSWMRITPPPVGIGYAPEFFEPHQQPQAPNTYKYNPVLGTKQYGTGVLNSDTYGAGQTAGGIGGNQYSPAPGPPDTMSTASNPPSNPSGMPTWG
jgi:hypothetical protein